MKTATKTDERDYTPWIHGHDAHQIERFVAQLQKQGLPEKSASDVKAYCQLSVVPREVQDFAEATDKDEVLDKTMIRELKRREMAVAKVPQLLDVADEFVGELIRCMRRVYTLNEKFDDEIRLPLMLSTLVEIATPPSIAQHAGEDEYRQAIIMGVNQMNVAVHAVAAGMRRMH